MELSERLQIERRRLRLNPKELSELIGQRPNAVTRWESGLASPQTSDLAQMALVGIDLTFLLTGRRISVIPSHVHLADNVRRFLEAYEDCSPEGKAYIRRAAARMAERAKRKNIREED